MNGTITIKTASQSYTIPLQCGNEKEVFEKAAELRERLNVQPWEDREIFTSFPSRMNNEDFKEN